MFFASDDRFEELDGQLFPRARAIQRRLEKVAGHRPSSPLAFPRVLSPATG
jgi:hypothetical protein